MYGWAAILLRVMGILPLGIAAETGPQIDYVHKIA